MKPSRIARLLSPFAQDPDAEVDLNAGEAIARQVDRKLAEQVGWQPIGGDRWVHINIEGELCGVLGCSGEVAGTFETRQNLDGRGRCRHHGSLCREHLSAIESVFSWKDD